MAVDQAETEWLSMLSMPIGDHRGIVFELRGLDGSTALGCWSGTEWVYADGDRRGDPIPFTPVRHRDVQSDSGRVEWSGGDCPVDKNAMVRVQARFETFFDEHQMPRRAGSWVWSHNPKDSVFDIIAYCVVSA